MEEENKRKKSSSLLVIVIVALISLAIGCTATWFIMNNNNSNDKSDKTKTSENTNKKENEKKKNDDKKKEDSKTDEEKQETEIEEEPKEETEDVVTKPELDPSTVVFEFYICKNQSTNPVSFIKFYADNNSNIYNYEISDGNEIKDLSSYKTSKELSNYLQSKGYVIDSSRVSHAFYICKLHKTDGSVDYVKFYANKLDNAIITTEINDGNAIKDLNTYKEAQALTDYLSKNGYLCDTQASA